MKQDILNLLVCPLCKSPLHYNAEESLLVCRAERLAFKVEDDVPILLEDVARNLSVEDTDRLTGRLK